MSDNRNRPRRVCGRCQKIYYHLNFCVHCLKLNDIKFYAITDESAQKTIGIKGVITKTYYLSNHDN